MQQNLTALQKGVLPGGTLRSECQAEDDGGVGGDTETVVGAETDEPEDGAGGVGDDELMALFKERKFQIGEEVTDEAMARHAKGTEGITLADGTEG